MKRCSIIHLFDTFSIVANPILFCTILTIDLSQNWPIHQLDVNDAFLMALVLNQSLYLYPQVSLILIVLTSCLVSSS